MLRANTPLTYLALGDSYTIGEGVAPGEGWPDQLVRHLRQHDLAMGDPQILATTGWTTDELDRAMDQATLAPAYDLVTLQIGVNNQYRGAPLADYLQQFSALLERASGLARREAARVVAVSIPDWGVTRFARERQRHAPTIALELDQFNAGARSLVTARGARWCDVTELSRQHADWLTADGLHPSARQYALWAARVLPHAFAALAVQDS